MIKQEHSSYGDKNFDNAVYSYLANKGLNNFYLTNNVPKLDDVRGKIVIIRRFRKATPPDDFGMHFYWEDNTKGASYDTEGTYIYVEDHYKLNTVHYSQKIREAKDSIKKARGEIVSQKFYLSFPSGERDARLISLEDVAKNINPDIRDWLSYSYAKKSGVILMNFAGGVDTEKHNTNRPCGREIVEYIIKMNYSGQAIWATNTYGNPGAYYSMQDDGNFVIITG